MTGSETVLADLSDELRRLFGCRSAEVTALPGHASTREYFRVMLSGGGPPSVIAMKLNPEHAFKSEEATGGEEFRLRELAFVNVQRFLKSGSIPVPEIFLDLTPRGYLLIEDFGDSLLLDTLGTPFSEREEERYRTAIDLLVRIQTHAARRPDPGCIAFHRRFGRELLLWEFNHFLEWGIEQGRGRTIEPDHRRQIEAGFETIVGELCRQPAEFVHRDFQSRNLMVRDGGLGVIDFQDALLGGPQYDLVALLRDSYVTIPEPAADRLVDHFLACRSAAGLPTPPRDAFVRLFRLQTIQRKLKDAGRFVYIDRVKHNPGFLGFIPASLAHVRRCLGWFREFSELQALLAGYEERLAAHPQAGSEG